MPTEAPIDLDIISTELSLRPYFHECNLPSSYSRLSDKGEV